VNRRRERRARARALQALYACDVRGGEGLLRVASTVFDDLAVEPGERALAVALIGEVASRQPELDAALKALTSNWRLERLGAIERSLLRLGAAELARGDTPPRVVLQEAVRLAERFGGLESARFINGVLDAVARESGRL
jgi:transcription antitermination protein NusB